MENTARKVVTLDQARVVGHVQLNLPEQPGPAMPATTPATSTFVDELTSATCGIADLRREHGRVVNEILVLQAENRWEEIIDLFHPVEEKTPALVAAAMDSDVRSKIAFALVRLHRIDEAIATLKPAIANQPEDAMLNYILGYAVLDELFTARTERRIVPGKRKKELVDLGHAHFSAARSLRPDSVTFCYREAILLKEIEGKSKLAIPLFEQAIANWDRQSPEKQAQHHQQRPKFIKSLYHLASCLLDAGKAGRSLQLLERLEQEDSDRQFIHPLFRHFAFGKVLHALGRYREALDRLETAAHVAERHQPTDFVWELAARCALGMRQVEKAQQCIAMVPENRRRPYVRWTEADVLAAQGRVDAALQVLRQCGERDRRARHVALIRMSRLLLGQREYAQGLAAAEQAVRFCEDTYGNPSKEGQFWQAAGMHLLGRNQEALQILTVLETGHFQYPHFTRLAGLIRAALENPTVTAETATSASLTPGRERHDAAAVNL